MKIMIAPDSFKGSLTATALAEAMGRGVRQVFPEAELDLVPMADHLCVPWDSRYFNEAS